MMDWLNRHDLGLWDLHICLVLLTRSDQEQEKGKFPAVKQTDSFTTGFKIELSSENNMSDLMTGPCVLQALMIFPIYIFICILRL